MLNFDYSRLRGKIKEIYGNNSKFAEKLNISPVTLSAKLNNHVGFSQNEIDKSRELFKLTNDEVAEYFFTKKVKQNLTKPK